MFPYGGYEQESQMATMADAHWEWHLNAGVPMGMPGCPQDACHGYPEDDEPDREPSKADEEGWDAREEWIATPFADYSEEPPF